MAYVLQSTSGKQYLDKYTGSAELKVNMICDAMSEAIKAQSTRNDIVHIDGPTQSNRICIQDSMTKSHFSFVFIYNMTYAYEVKYMTVRFGITIVKKVVVACVTAQNSGSSRTKACSLTRCAQTLPNLFLAKCKI